MNLKLFLSRKKIIDREWGNFYLLILLIYIVCLNCWLLIQKMRFYISKSFSCDLSLFVYNFSFYCLPFCSNVSNCLCMWSDYKIVFLVVFFTIVLTIVCLFPKFWNDIRFRMRDARSC